MKRFLCTVLALLMLFSSMFILSACDEKDKDDDEKTTEEASKELPTYDVPTGYSLYEDEYISFAYPSSWTKSEMSGVLLIIDNSSGNNITLAYEPYSTVYETMDLAGFNDLLLPMLTAQGITVSGVVITQEKNDNKVPVTKITFTAVHSGVSMKQTVFVVASGNYNVALTVTEVKSVPTVLDTVFESMIPQK